jgi:hypothetical protein
MRHTGKSKTARKVTSNHTDMALGSGSDAGILEQVE